MLPDRFTESGSIPVSNNFEKAAGLLNQGLKSNGPFYSRGYYISKIIADKTGEKQFGKIISQGSLAFFNEFLKICESDQNIK